MGIVAAFAWLIYGLVLLIMGVCWLFSALCNARRDMNLRRGVPLSGSRAH